MELGDETVELGPGGWSIAPAGVPHGITAGPDGARFTAVVVPRRENAGAETVAAP